MNTQLKWPTSVLNNDAVETEVVDTPVTGRSPTPQKKAQSTKAVRVTSQQFSVAHGQTLDMLTISFVLGGAIAQGVLSKFDAQGIPATESYWIAIALLLPTLFLIASKTGNQRMWIVLCKLAIALAVSPGAAQGLHIVFGG